MGWTASELRALPELDTLPAGGVLLLPHQRQALNAERMGAILRWVERGGHLLVEAEPLSVPDALLDLVGAQREDGEVLPKPIVFDLPQTGRKLTVSMTSGMKLVAPQARVRLRIGDRLMSLERGRGMVTIASTLQFARNRSIGANDHAELLWQLLQSTPGRALVVYFRPEQLSLWNFLKENAAPALAAGAVLLALWVWSIAPRFGPVAPDLPPGRRRLLDHLRASGRYYWARGLRSRLVVAARDAALRRLTRAQPDFATASQVERAARLSSLIQISKEDAARFIDAAGAMRGADFIKLTQQAQRVHSALEKGDK
jgi:hypothetical protein